MTSNILKLVWENYLLEKSDIDYTSLYIHFPFCSQVCNFCKIHPLEITNLDVVDSYLDDLEIQFKEASVIFKNEPIKACGVGGGSPSLLSEKQLIRLISLIEKYWNIQPEDNMFSFEFHPHHVSSERIKVLQESYFNRISLGVQSLSENVLQNENRIYPLESKLFDDYNMLVDSFDVVNIDLIYGLSDQTHESFIEDISKFVSVGADKITIYGYDNRRNNRQEKNDDAYYLYFQKAMVDVHNTFEDQGYLFSGSDYGHYSEYNVLYKDRKVFNNYYSAEPHAFNNCVAFNISMRHHPHSFFVPTNVLTETSDDVYIRSLCEHLGIDDWSEVLYYRNNILKNPYMIKDFEQEFQYLYI